MITQTVTFIDRKPDTRILYMGNEDEHQCEAIRFKLPAWLEGAGVSLLLSIGNYSDIVGLGADRIYRPTRTHMSRPGMWTGYITATMGEDLVWNSDTFQINIQDLPEFAEKIEQENPTILEDAIRILNVFTGLEARVETLEAGSQATVKMEESENGTRTIVYGIPKGRAGNDGFSPTVEVTEIDGGYRLTITDKNSTKSIDLLNGKNSTDTPDVNLQDGFSPTIEVTEIDGGYRLTITDKNSTKSIDLLNGKDGKDGKDGHDGSTPERGVDYWTDADKAEIKSYVDEAILGGEW